MQQQWGMQMQPGQAAPAYGQGYQMGMYGEPRVNQAQACSLSLSQQ